MQKLVCRTLEGNNPEHTIKFDWQTHDFHILSSNLSNLSTNNLIISGWVVHFLEFIKELEDLGGKGVLNFRKIFSISHGVHVVLDLHLKTDGLQEAELGGLIETTEQGIRPCYSTKASRSGIRIKDNF